MFPFTSVQLITTADQSLNGYMVASREDTGTELDGNVSYVGSWEQGTGMKLLCDGVSTFIKVTCYIRKHCLLYNSILYVI